MLILEIKLLSNNYGASPWSSAKNEAKVEIIPSPLRIIRAILSGMYQDSYIKTNEFDNLSEEQIKLVTKLCGTNPSYYIPQYSHSGTVTYHPDYVTSLRNIAVSEKESQSSSRIAFDPFISVDAKDNNIMVYYDVTLTSSQREIISSALEYLTYLGRSEYPAKWKVLRQSTIKPNCFESSWGEVVELVNPNCENLLNLLSTSPEQLKEEGYRIPPFMKVGFYKLDAIRSTRPTDDSKSIGMEAFISIDASQKVHVSHGLRLTNTLHKALVKATKHPQAIGYTNNEFNQKEFLEEKEKLRFLFKVIGETIVGIRVICLSRIADQILLALRSLSYLYLLDTKISTRLIGVKRHTPIKSKKYRTITPAIPHVEPRKSLKRKPGSIIGKQTLTHLLNKKVEATYEEIDNVIHIDSKSSLGILKVEATEIISVVPFRGDRIAGGTKGYFVSLEFETPVELISIGAHSFFGMGEVEPYQ